MLIVHESMPFVTVFLPFLPTRRCQERERLEKKVFCVCICLSRALSAARCTLFSSSFAACAPAFSGARRRRGRQRMLPVARGA